MEAAAAELVDAEAAAAVAAEPAATVVWAAAGYTARAE